MKTIPTTETLAREFAKVLLEDIGEPSLRKAVLLNLREPDKDVCHTHDYCDSNMSMVNAYARLAGIPADSVDVCNDPFVAVANEAWSLAKSKGFYLPDATTVGEHTPFYTAKILQSLQKAFPSLSFVDTSWHHDMVDSIEIQDIKYDAFSGDERETAQTNRYKIWIPDTAQGEDYSQFGLDDRMKEDEQSDYETERFATFEDLVERIKQIIA